MEFNLNQDPVEREENFVYFKKALGKEKKKKEKDKDKQKTEKKKEDTGDKEHLKGDYRTLIDRMLDPKVNLLCL